MNDENLQKNFEAALLKTEELLPEPPVNDYLGWKRYVDKPGATRPAMPTDDEFKAMDAESKKSFRRIRKIYHSKFGPIETDYLGQVLSDAINLAAANYNMAPGARPGIVLDGLGTVGKSTIVMEIGKKYEKLIRKSLNLPHNLPNGSTFIPVAYISLPGNLSIKRFDARMVSYFNIPIPSKSSDMWLSEQIITTARECGTSLVIVDDVHFVNMRNKSGKEVNNHFKYLASHISATFLYAGIYLDKTLLMSEGASIEKAHRSQTAGRFKRYRIEPFKKGSEPYASLIATFDSHLLLMNQTIGDLYETFGDYIHDRTNGFIGAISNLLRTAANLAIDNGTERITKSLLDRVQLDEASENHRSTTPNKS